MRLTGEDDSEQSPSIARPVEQALGVPASAQWLIDEGISDNTRRAQRSDARYVAAWQEARFGRPAFPVSIDQVTLFITDHLAGLPTDLDQALVDAGVKTRLGPHKWTTVSRRLATVAALHRAAGVSDPTKAPEIQELLKRSRPALAGRGERPTKKRAATKSVLEALLATCGDDRLLDVRDHALLLFGAASGGRRRSEIAAAIVEDLEPVADGYLFRPRVTKTHQQGETRAFPIVGRAARSLDRWFRESGVSSGPIFRSIGRGKVARELPLSGQDVGNIVKRRAGKAGFDSKDFGGHSLRRGFVTEAGRQGVSIGDAMALSGHRSVATALGYYESGAAETSTAARIFDEVAEGERSG